MAERSRHWAVVCKTSAILSVMDGIGLGRCRDIHTFTNPRELRSLYDLAAAVPEGGRIIEVGSYLGGGTCYLLAGANHRNARVTAVDTWGNETMPDGQRDTFDTFCSNVGSPRGDLSIVRALSTETSREDFPGKADLVFIDADHSYEAVKADFRHYEQFANDACVFAFHDCNAYPGVTRTVGEAIASGEWHLKGIVHSLVWLQRPGCSQ